MACSGLEHFSIKYLTIEIHYCYIINNIFGFYDNNLKFVKSVYRVVDKRRINLFIII
jgi:hypothetical protein